MLRQLWPIVNESTPVRTAHPTESVALFPTTCPETVLQDSRVILQVPRTLPWERDCDVQTGLKSTSTQQKPDTRDRTFAATSRQQRAIGTGGWILSSPHPLAAPGIFSALANQADWS